jgi:naphthoate synthase
VPEGAKVGRFHVTDLHVQMRRLPKPIIAMVAGYAVGGGQILHLVCDLSIAAENARFGQTGRAWAPSTAASAPRCWPRRSAAQGEGDLVPLPPVRRAGRRSTWASSTPSCRSSGLEQETVAWCREMLALSPFALRLVKASFHAHEDGYAGDPAARARRQPPLLRERGGRGGPRGVQGQARSPTSPSSRGGREPA